MLTMTYLVMGQEVIKKIEGFSLEDAEGSTNDNLTSSDDKETFVNQQQKNRKKQAIDSPDGLARSTTKREKQNCNISPNLLLSQDLVSLYQMMLMSYIFSNFSTHMNYLNQ